MKCLPQWSARPHRSKRAVAPLVSGEAVHLLVLRSDGGRLRVHTKSRFSPAVKSQRSRIRGGVEPQRQDLGGNEGVPALHFTLDLQLYFPLR
jgi:hypothetical protein